MISNTIVNELERKLGYIIRTFGTTQDFINIIIDKQKTNSDSNSYLYTLLNTELVSIISPWNYTIKLFDSYTDTNFSNDSIVVDEPYNIYNQKGQLLYSVTGHNGLFGNSKLDKLLLLQSDNADMYYLQYMTYTGLNKTRLLIVNNKSIVKVDSNVSSVVPIVSNIEETKVNQLLFSYSSTFTVYFIPSAPVRIPTKEAITNNPYVTRYTNNSFLTVNVEKSGWIVATNSNGTFLKLNEIIGAGVDRLLPVDEEKYIHYLIIGSEIDVTTARQSLRLRGLNNSSSTNSHAVNLNINLVI